MEREHDEKKVGKLKKEMGVRYEDNSLYTHYTHIKFFKITSFLNYETV